MPQQIIRKVFAGIAIGCLLLAGMLPAACAQQRLPDANASPELLPLIGHTNAVTSLAFSPDGRFLASAGKDRTAKIWDGKTCTLLRTLPCLRAPLLAVAFSRDGSRVFTAGQDGTAQCWDTHTGSLLEETRGPAMSVTAIAIQPVGAVGNSLLMAASLPDRTIRLWRWKTLSGAKAETAVLRGHEKTIQALRFAPDGKMLASGSEDGVVKTWDTEDGELQYSLISHAMPIRSLGFSGNSRTLADASDDGETNLWNMQTGKQIGDRLQMNRPGDEGVSAVAFSSDGKQLAQGGPNTLASRKETILLWNLPASRADKALTGHTNAVEALVFSPDGSRLASGGKDNVIRLWNARTGKQIAWSGQAPAVNAVAFAPNARLLASACSDAAVRVWNTRTGELLRLLLGHQGGVNAVAFSSDGKWLASGGQDAILHIWEAATGVLRRTWKCAGGEVTTIAFSPDGALLATGHRQDRLRGSIELHNAQSGQLVKVLEEQGPPPIDALAFSPDGTRIASSGGKGRIGEFRVWDAQTGKMLQQEFMLGVHAVAFSPNGKTLVSDSRIRQVEEPEDAPLRESIAVWNGRTSTFQRAGVLPDAEGWINTLVVLPDNQTLISGSESGLLRAWNLRTGEVTKTWPQHHQAAIRALALSPDGKLLASAGADSAIRLWNVITGEPLVTLLSTSAPGANVPVQGRNVAGEDAPSSDWLAVTQTGYFDGSANASRAIQWRIGRDLFPVEAYEGSRHKPEALKAALNLAPRMGAQPILSPPPSPTAPPRIFFSEPTEGNTLSGDKLHINGYVTDSSDVLKIEFLVNGRRIDSKPILLEGKPLLLEGKPILLEGKPILLEGKPIPAQHKYYQPFRGDVTLPSGDGQITLAAQAYDKNRLAAREEVHLNRPVALQKGTLYVLAVGVSRYRDAKYNLKYARSDAEAFAEMWKRKSGSLYSGVQATLLLDEQATANNIRAALFKLAEQATEQDCVALFLSGHGVQDGATYYFASEEIAPTRDQLKDTALPWTALQTALSAIRARRVILFLDACHSGNALGGMQANSEHLAEALVKRAGVMVFASSRGSEYSYELDEKKHGAFTVALLEGLDEGKANLEIGGQRADTISAEDLLAYLRRRVPQLTDNRQTPSCPLIRDFGDAFPLVQVTLVSGKIM